MFALDKIFPEHTLGTVDYIVFGILIITSCTGGLWYSAKGSRKKAVKDVSDYLLGGKMMKTFPVALSLIASYVSGVTILGTPAETYNYGIQYWLIMLAVCSSAFIVAVVYLPVFVNLKVHSSYEYLELRFNKHVRAIASILFLLDEVLFLPMVLYVPALAFNQMTGFNEFAIAVVMVVICGLYTALGGLRAVVWTDAWQTCIMIISVIIVAIVGTVYIGDLTSVYEVSNANNRFDLKNWKFSMYERQSGWAVLIGGIVYWTAFNSVNQTMVQRYIAVPTKKKAIKSLAIFCCGVILSISLCMWCGLLAFVAWVQAGCDPSGSPLVNDRLFPSFVMHVSRSLNTPGLGGIFLAGVFGAGLSSLSAVLNACALVAIEDIMHSWLNKYLTPFMEGILARCLTASLAVSSILMLVIISKLGGVLGVATSLSAIAASTSCGIFTLGMACPWVGPRGALIGGLAGAIVAGTVSMGTQVAAGRGFRSPALPLEPGCAANASFAPSTGVDPETVFPLFRISYHWIAPMGLLATLVVGAFFGWLWDNVGIDKMDIHVYTPVIWRWLPEEYHKRKGSVRLSHARFSRPSTPPSMPLIVNRDKESKSSAENNNSESR